MAKSNDKNEPKEENEDQDIQQKVIVGRTELPYEPHPQKYPEKILYEIDPNKVDKDIVVSTTEPVKLLPKGKHNQNATLRLKKGDRVKGAYFAEMVTEHKVEGLQLCCNLSKEYLKDLDKERQKRIGTEPEKWIQEAHANIDYEAGKVRR